MKKKLLSLLLVVIMVVTCAVAFTACGETPPEKITFLLDWAPNTNHTGLYVAKHLGYYADAGLDVTFVQPDLTGQSGSVAAGNGQFGIDFQEQMIFHEQQGVNVTAVASIIQHNTSGIVAKKSVGLLNEDGSINGKAMESHKYATWGIPGEQAIVKTMCQVAGGDVATFMDNTIENTVVDVISEFKNNDTGAEMIWIYEAWDGIRLKNSGVEYDYVPIRETEGLDFYTPVIVGNNDYLKDYPEQAAAFVKATQKGYEYAIAHPLEAVDIFIKEVPELLSGDAQQQAADKKLLIDSQTFLATQYQAEAEYWGYIDSNRWNKFFETVIAMGDKDFPTAVTKDFGFTNKFVAK